MATEETKAHIEAAVSASASSGETDGGAFVLSPAEREKIERFRRAHATQVLTILFTDCVGSTQLQSELGNVAAAHIVQSHYEVMRRVLVPFDGLEIKTAGDSMLLVFAAPSEAVRFALQAQRALRERRAGQPRLPEVRIGIHQGQVVLQRDEILRARPHAPAGTTDDVGGPADVLDVYGLQVSMAARIMGLAAGGQILCSRAVFDDARAILRSDDVRGLSAIAWRNHGPYRFKGVDDHHEVCEVGEEGTAPLAAPPASAKAWPADRTQEELGWRPAAGGTVPETNWRLEQKLGEGEFGEVWKAYNPGDKSHQVFKFCFKRDKLPALQREARLLKRLRKYAHPSLVEVYDVTEGERPPHYLEMEYVEGPSVVRWMETQPSLADRLEVVAQIADALDVVHAAGIFHRDIKPANILVARREDGAILAKLTDFGLGAAEDMELLRSLYASRVEGVAGTWDYLAPELRAGRSASARSDLYALGIVLYQVVVRDLARPFTADWEGHVPTEILREDIRRSVAQLPDDRWARAADMARALRSHDQRLRAREVEREREEHRLRARSLRKAAIAASFVAVLTVVLGGFALHQWQEAARQRDRAIAQKRLALEAITKLTHEVPLRLRDIPGTLPALKGILEENIEMLDRILDLEPDTPFARRERGVNLVSVGDRWMLLGDSQRAFATFEKALRIARSLSATDPKRAEYRHDVSIVLDRLGGARLAMGNAQAALEAYQEAMAIACELRAADPTARRARRDVWLSHDKLGEVYRRLGRTQDALDAYEQAMAIAQSLAQEHPEDTQAQRDLSLCYERIGDIRLILGRTEEALQAYQAGMEIGQRQAAAHPESAQALRDLSVGFDKLGGVYLKLNKRSEALQAYQRSMDTSRLLAQKEPENAQFQRDLSIGYDRLGDVYLDLGRKDDALACYEAAMKMGRERAAKDPSNAGAQYDLAAGHSKLGNVRLAAGKHEEALADYSAAIQILKRLREADPADAAVVRSISVLGNKMAAAQLLLGRTPQAIRSFEEAAEVARQLAAKDPQNQEVQRDLGVSRFQAMAAYRAAGDLANWRKAADEAAAQFEAVLAAAGGSPDAKGDLVHALAEAAASAATLPGAASDDLRVALSRIRRAIQLSGRTDPLHLETEAALLALTGDPAAAVAALEKALSVLPKDQPGQPADSDQTRKRLQEKLDLCRDAVRALRGTQDVKKP